jgi:hypothetical protein
VLARVVLGLRREPLPTMVDRLSQPAGQSAHRYPARRLVQFTDRALRLTPYQPRCVVRALVAYRLLRAQGDRPELVIGLPEQANRKDAHAWIEIDGLDIGPPPGRSDHVELARYR